MTGVRFAAETVTVHVPFRIVKRGGRKEMVLPPAATARRNMDDTLVKALARAFRWKRMLDSGEFSTIGELAQRERIAAPYLARVMRLSSLAPDIVDAILNGRQPQGMTMESLRVQLPDDWECQRILVSATVRE